MSTGLDDKNPEAYRLVVGDNNISIQGASAAGVFYGIQTLRKAMADTEHGNVVYPAVEINDFPRFHIVECIWMFRVISFRQILLSVL